VALVFGWLLFDERVSGSQLVGCALVVAGIALPLARIWWARLMG
jgi:drug/metabolite transporter (DMT)-like permease